MLICDARRGYGGWLAASRNLSDHTLRVYDSDLSVLIAFLGSGTSAQHISSVDMLRFVEDQRRAGLAAASLKRRVSAIRGFCRWLCATELVEEDPWKDIELDLSGPRRLPRPVSASDVRCLVNYLCDVADVGTRGVPNDVMARPAEATTLLAVALMVSTGVRVGELVALRVADIDLRDGTLRVLGKGLRERQVYLSDEWIHGLLNSYLLTRVDAGVSHERLLFNHHGGELTPAALRTRLSRASRLAGLVTKVTPHRLRHTAATQLVESGVSIRVIQRLLGHASIATTEIYTHVSDTALRRAVSAANVLAVFLVYERPSQVADRPDLARRIQYSTGV